MRQPLSTRRSVPGPSIVLAIAILPGFACSSPPETEPQTTTSSDSHPLPCVCRDSTVCSEEVEVDGDASLAGALADAKPGTCLVLASGAYGEVALPPGVKLLGGCSGSVAVGSVSISAGDGAELCGVHIGGEGLTLSDATGVTAREVDVSSSGNGVVLTGASSITIVSSQILGAEKVGVYGSGDVAVTMQDSTVATSGDYGVELTCGQDDCCAPGAPRPRLDLSSSSIVSNRVAGVGLFGADATLNDVTITGTKPGDKIHFGEGGFGLAATQCSSIEGRGLTISANRLYGMLIQASGALLGGPDSKDGIAITDNMMGIVINGATEARPVHIEGATIDSNMAIGLWVIEGAKAVSLLHSTVSRTTEKSLPAGNGFQVKVGDGILWQGVSNVILDDVQTNDNARAGLLIDGPVGSGVEPSLLRNVVATGNGAVGLLQQSLPPGGATPDLEGTDLEISETEVLQVP